MNLINKRPLSMAEVKEFLNADDEKSKQMNEYLKNFSKTTKDKAKKMIEEIRALNNPKIKEENIMKVVDILPEDAEDINKIFTEASLTEEETNAILEIVKKH